MKKYLAIALLSLSASVMAQEVNDFKEETTPQDTKTWMALRRRLHPLRNV